MTTTMAMGLYLRTARHLRASQIAARLGLYARRRTLHRWPRYLRWRYAVPADEIRLAEAPLLPSDPADLAAALRGSPEAGRAAAALADLAANRFAFLNRQVEFGEAVPWGAPGGERLWRYNLHYFDYAWPLILADALGGESGDDAAYRCFRRLAESWIDANPVPSGVGWHAYPVALRVVNWAYAVHALSRHLAGDAPFRRRLLASLYGQARFLADHLEWDSRGNHLIADGKALLAAGLLFAGREAAGWRRQGGRIVWAELRRQVLPDGGHYERSPMYHAIVLADYLEVAALRRARGLPLPPGAAERLRAMVDYRVALRHPDGEIPLFGDAAPGIARDLADLLPLAAALLDAGGDHPAGGQAGPYAAFFLGRGPDLTPRPPSPRGNGERAASPLPPGGRGVGELGLLALPHAGYYRLGDGRGNALLLDGGEIGPDEVPAHGHCGIFSYELSVAGRRVVVDSGVATYEPGRWRDYYRSTRAHNTLVVDGLDQSEVWAAFRVGRRARVSGVRWGAADGFAWFVGAHDGFSRATPGLRHRRLVAWVAGACWLVVDEVAGAAGEHALESLVHLHPEIEAADSRGPGPAETGPVLLCWPGGAPALRLVPFGFDRLAAGVSWHAPRFGEVVPNTALALGARARLPHRCGYALVPAAVGPVTLRVETRGSGEEYVLAAPGREYRVTRGSEGLALSVEGLGESGSDPGVEVPSWSS